MLLNLLKYTRVARGQNRVEVKSMIDLVLVKKDILHFIQEVRLVETCIKIESAREV